MGTITGCPSCNNIQPTQSFNVCWSLHQYMLQLYPETDLKKKTEIVGENADKITPNRASKRFLYLNSLHFFVRNHYTLIISKFLDIHVLGLFILCYALPPFMLILSHCGSPTNLTIFILVFCSQR